MEATRALSTQLQTLPTDQQEQQSQQTSAPSPTATVAQNALQNTGAGKVEASPQATPQEQIDSERVEAVIAAIKGLKSQITGRGTEKSAGLPSGMIPDIRIQLESLLRVTAAQEKVVPFAKVYDLSQACILIAQNAIINVDDLIGACWKEKISTEWFAAQLKDLHVRCYLPLLKEVRQLEKLVPQYFQAELNIAESDAELVEMFADFTLSGKPSKVAELAHNKKSPQVLAGEAKAVAKQLDALEGEFAKLLGKLNYLDGVRKYYEEHQALPRGLSGWFTPLPAGDYLSPYAKSIKEVISGLKAKLKPVEEPTATAQ